jgi:hypothetical protein
MYPCFVSILSLCGDKHGVPGFTVDAAVTVLQFQARVYEQWFEVMLDYATAFSKEPASAYHDADPLRVFKGFLGQSDSKRQYRVTTARSEVFDIVHDALRSMQLGWEELPAGLGMGTSWNLLWTWGSPRVDHRQLLVWQKVNHFKDTKQLTRKDLLKRHLQRLVELGGKDSDAFAIMPVTFVLPNEYVQFVSAFRWDYDKS